MNTTTFWRVGDQMIRLSSIIQVSDVARSDRYFDREESGDESGGRTAEGFGFYVSTPNPEQGANAWFETKELADEARSDLLVALSTS